MGLEIAAPTRSMSAKYHARLFSHRKLRILNQMRQALLPEAVREDLRDSEQSEAVRASRLQHLHRHNLKFTQIIEPRGWLSW